MARFEKVADQVIGEKIIEVKVKREDATRGRLRTIAAEGEDLIIELPRGATINNGDIFGPSEKGQYYKTLIEPEPVIKVTLEKAGGNRDVENALRLGYSLGNRHLEVLIEGDAVYVPITIAEEKIQEMLRKTSLPINVETLQRVISTAARGYFAGEEEE